MRLNEFVVLLTSQKLKSMTNKCQARREFPALKDIRAASEPFELAINELLAVVGAIWGIVISLTITAIIIFVYKVRHLFVWLNVSHCPSFPMYAADTSSDSGQFSPGSLWVLVTC